MPDEHATREERSKADLGRGAAPPEPDRVRRHQRAPRHRRHPHPHHLYDRICATAADLKTHGDPAPLGRPQGHRPPEPRRHPEDQALPAPRPHRPDDDQASAGSRSSAPPPPPRSATGSATPGSPSNPSSGWTETDAVDAHDPPAWMRDLVILRDPRCVFPHCQRDARGCDLDHIDPVRRHRPTRPNQPSQPRPALPKTPPRQDHRPLAIPTTTRRHLRMDRTRHRAPHLTLRHAQVQCRRITVATSNGSLPRCAASTPAPSGEPV